MEYSAKDIPEIKGFNSIDFPDYRKIVLSNGIPVFILPSKEYDVLKIEINIKGGRIFESQKGVARACANLLKEGSLNYDSENIARQVDFHGASLNTVGGMDFSRIELYSLKKHYEKLLPILRDVLCNPLFPQKELDSYINRNIQRLAIDLSKNDVLAYRKLTELIFGPDHPYGYNSDEKIFRDLKQESLLAHFKENYLLRPFSVIIAGGVDDKIIEHTDSILGQIEVEQPEKETFWKTKDLKRESLNFEAPQQYQASIRMGRKLFNRSHPDYGGLYVLNTILGGYFGSRLMKNIREEKGLTYDIYSTIDMLLLDGYLMIGAEVDNENVGLALDEIKREFEALKKDIIPEGELQLVKNYINGNLLNLMNGPFNSIELIRLIAVYEQNMDFFNRFMENIKSVDSESIRLLANKYLDQKDFYEIIVGN